MILNIFHQILNNLLINVTKLAVPLLNIDVQRLTTDNVNVFRLPRGHNGNRSCGQSTGYICVPRDKTIHKKGNVHIFIPV